MALEQALQAPGARSEGGRWLMRGLLRFARKKTGGAVAAVVLCLAIAVALGADRIAPYDPLEPAVVRRLSAPQPGFWMGSDSLGRDVMSRVIHGSRISLYVGTLSVLMGTAVGSLVGLVSAYILGKFDLVVQRVVDSMQAFPDLVLALLLITFLGSGVNQVIIAISFVIAPATSRVVRGAVLSVKENAYIEAARSIGVADLSIIFRHILPNVMAPILVVASVWLGNAIVVEATLSFLGLGAPPPAPTWGNMLSQGSLGHMEDAPWLAIFPGLAISLVVLAFNIFGDALRDIWDPYLQGR